MRKRRAIDALFSRTRREILGATYDQPDRWWYLSELAGHLNTTPSSLQRELQSLVLSGILRQRRDGKRIYFRAEEKSSIFDELRSIVAKTMGVAAALERTLAEFDDRIACAFLSGSLERGDENELSEVDLVVIGSVGLSDLSPPLLKLETKYKLDFDATCYSPEGFLKKVADQNHLVVNLLREEKVFLIGDDNDLETLLRNPGQRPE